MFHRYLISIHALREEGDLPELFQFVLNDISIHALREEGDLLKELTDAIDLISIHALREEGDADAALTVDNIRIISIHALREEGDGLLIAPTRCLCNFYPRPPRGGRRETSRRDIIPKVRFLSTPSARRATAKTETKSLFSYKLYNILHEFRRALIYNGSKNYPNHAK